jgi:hypothetical protein
VQRRKPLKRGQPPKRSKPIARSRTPIPARRKDPAKRRFAKHRCDPYREWLKAEACCVSGLFTGEYIGGRAGYRHLVFVKVLVDPAHTRPRSLGADDLYECIPLARHLHEEQERIRWPRFEAKYGIDRHELARQYTEQWLETPEGQAWVAGRPAPDPGATA